MKAGSVVEGAVAETYSGNLNQLGTQVTNYLSPLAGQLDNRRKFTPPIISFCKNIHKK